MTGIQQLKELALQDSRRRHSTLPEGARCTHNYNPRTANGLTKCIIDWLRFNNQQAERINCVGRPQDNTRIITDVVGFSRRIGSIKWLPTSGQKGTADISAVIRGRAVKIEVKIKDRQSADQKAYQANIEAAGGLYWLVRSFDEFIELYNTIVNGNNH